VEGALPSALTQLKTDHTVELNAFVENPKTCPPAAIGLPAAYFTDTSKIVAAATAQ
jgi:hypothetical protein